jgi:hypothetical protein
MVAVSAATCAGCITDLPEAGRDWLLGRVDALAQGRELSALSSLFAEAGRRVGRKGLAGRLPAEGAPPLVLLDSWAADDAARAALLIAASGSAEDAPALVRSLYDGGDGREKAAIVRALALLPEPGRFMDVAADACRSSDGALFRALFCGNAYPFLYFDERQWNALIMKAVFVGVPVGQVMGLSGRANAELGRMARDYRDERTAAGREVPASIEELLELCARSTG